VITGTHKTQLKTCTNTNYPNIHIAKTQITLVAQNAILMIDAKFQLMLSHEDQFSDDFFEWLPNNEHIYDAFSFETMKIIRKGYQHYSGRTILEVLRHHSALSEQGIWKLNNNHTPYLCRLFALMNPRFAEIFEYRTVKKPKLRLEK
jgi:hypothetical protein